MTLFDSYDDYEWEIVRGFLDQTLDEHGLYHWERTHVEDHVIMLLEENEFDLYNSISPYLLGLEELPQSRFSMANSLMYASFFCMGKDSANRDLIPGHPNEDYLDVARRILVDTTEQHPEASRVIMNNVEIALEHFDTITEVTGHVIRRMMRSEESAELSDGVEYLPLESMPLPYIMCHPNFENQLTLTDYEHEDELLHMGYEFNLAYFVIDRHERAAKAAENYQRKEQFFDYTEEYFEKDMISKASIWPMFNAALESYGYSQYTLAHLLREEEVKNYNGMNQQITPHSERDDTLSYGMRQTSVAEILNRTFMLKSMNDVSRVPAEGTVIFNSLMEKLRDEFIGLYVHDNVEFKFDPHDRKILEGLTNVYGFILDYALENEGLSGPRGI